MMRTSSTVLLSGVIATVTQLAGMVVWFSTSVVTLERFDLSSVQSVEDNPAGYLIPWVGTLSGMVLLWMIGMRLRRWLPAAGVMLMASMAIFVGNSLFSIVWPEYWEVHAFLARVSFLTLIGAQILCTVRRQHGIEHAVAYACLVAAVVLFILPKYGDIDLMWHLTRVQSDTILGITEGLYIIIIYTTLYRVIRSFEEVAI